MIQLILIELFFTIIFYILLNTIFNYFDKKRKL